MIGVCHSDFIPVSLAATSHLLWGHNFQCLIDHHIELFTSVRLDGEWQWENCMTLFKVFGNTFINKIMLPLIDTG